MLLSHGPYDPGMGEAIKLWEPSAEMRQRATMTRYLRWLETERGLSFGEDYHALWRWSTDDLEAF